MDFFLCLQLPTLHSSIIFPPLAVSPNSNSNLSPLAEQLNEQVAFCQLVNWPISKFTTRSSAGRPLSHFSQFAADCLARTFAPLQIIALIPQLLVLVRNEGEKSWARSKNLWWQRQVEVVSIAWSLLIRAVSGRLMRHVSKPGPRHRLS